MTRKGFTLVELIVVIAIIAILAAVVAPNAFKAIEKAKVAKTTKDLKAIKTAVIALYTDTGKFPNGCTGFNSANPEVDFGSADAGLLTRPAVHVIDANCEWTDSQVSHWDGPYLENRRVTDFWKTRYQFDPDYCHCSSSCSYSPASISTCTSSSSAALVAECRGACGGNLNCAPPVILSWGPDKSSYTCDDIIVQMTLK